jgi:L-alanine-DL-glutamate epimerase-like enolase superfamily enzyme
MKIAKLEFFPASIPYKHREISSQVNRDGVTDIIIKATTDDGVVGWDESCSGADVKSVLAALEAMRPFVLGRTPLGKRSDPRRALVALVVAVPQAGRFAFAGMDIVLWDTSGQIAGQPLYNLFGGSVRD